MVLEQVHMSIQNIMKKRKTVKKMLLLRCEKYAWLDDAMENFNAPCLILIVRLIRRPKSSKYGDRKAGRGGVRLMWVGAQVSGNVENAKRWRLL